MRTSKSKQAFYEALNKRLTETEHAIVAKVKHLLAFGNHENSKKLIPPNHSRVRLEVHYYVRGFTNPLHKLRYVFTYSKVMLMQDFGWFGANLNTVDYPYRLRKGRHNCPKLNNPHCFLFDELIWAGIAPEDVHHVSKVWFTLTYENSGNIAL